MDKHLFLTFLLTIVAGVCFTQQYGSLKDPRDGRMYNTVKIGNQVWMAENLNTDRFRNGDLIPEAKTNEEWELADDNKQPAWCYYNNDSANAAKFGKLYNWYAVNDKRGLAPKNWHIASDADFRNLTNFLGGKKVAGYKMKSTNGWFDNGNGSNSSGYSGSPGSFRNCGGQFNHISKFGYWWTSTDTDYSNAWCRIIGAEDFEISNFSLCKSAGMAVRCIKD
jgi:uncharacterized protein (TIGR02145 family)